jgi:hypothetical protein
VEHLSPRELDSIYRSTVAMTLGRWPAAYDERPRRRKIMVLPALVVIAVTALCVIAPDLLGVKL